MGRERAQRARDRVEPVRGATSQPRQPGMASRCAQRTAQLAPTPATSASAGGRARDIPGWTWLAVAWRAAHRVRAQARRRDHPAALQHDRGDGDQLELRRQRRGRGLDEERGQVLQRSRAVMAIAISGVVMRGRAWSIRWMVTRVRAPRGGRGVAVRARFTGGRGWPCLSSAQQHPVWPLRGLMFALVHQDVQPREHEQRQRRLGQAQQRGMSGGAKHVDLPYAQAGQMDHRDRHGRRATSQPPGTQGPRRAERRRYAASRRKVRACSAHALLASSSR